MWLEDFRRAHGLTLEELGAYIRRLGRKKHPEITVSDILLERLEGEPKFRTVPAIADLIAEACGATAQQRDRLVLEKDRGTWKPKPGRKPTPKPKAPVEEEPEPKNDGHHHPVVAVDRAGFAVMRFVGVKNAAARCGVSHKMVYSRCLRQLGRDEFRALGFTFRYAEEWDRMTDAERRADVAWRRNAGDGGGVDAAETAKDVAVDNRRYEGEAGTPSNPAEAGRENTMPGRRPGRRRRRPLPTRPGTCTTSGAWWPWTGRGTRWPAGTW